VSVDADRADLELLVHEVRSPVAALAAISEALRDEGLEPNSTRELVRLAVAACRSVTRIVEDAASGPLRLSDVDVGALVRDIVAAAALEGGKVRAQVEEGLPRVRADEVRLRQALDNLVRNALVHSGSEDEAGVRVHRDRASLLLSVSDAGRGIAQSEHERILESGSRLDASQPGTGLGLALVLSIAREHGGTLTVESAPSAGATFTIVLPLEGGSTEGA